MDINVLWINLKCCASWRYNYHYICNWTLGFDDFLFSLYKLKLLKNLGGRLNFPRGWISPSNIQAWTSQTYNGPSQLSWGLNEAVTWKWTSCAVLETLCDGICGALARAFPASWCHGVYSCSFDSPMALKLRWHCAIVGHRIIVAKVFIIKMIGGTTGIYCLGGRKEKCSAWKKLLTSISFDSLYLSFTHHLEDRIAR